MTLLASRRVTLPLPAPDQDGTNNSGELEGPLPRWSLDALYSGPDDARLPEDFAWLESECSKMAAEFEGRIADLDAEELLRAIRKSETISARMARISAFAQLRFAEDSQDPLRGKFSNDCSERLSQLTKRLLFLQHEVSKIDDQRYGELLRASGELARYRNLLDNTRKSRPHLLSIELEQFIVEQSAAGRLAWRRLFDETVSAMRFKIDGSTLPLELALDKLNDRSRTTRRRAARALARTFGEHKRVLTLITNSLAKDKAVEDEWRKFPTPQASRHLDNEVDAEVVDALRQAVIESYPRISHRYYRLKAEWLGLKRLSIWDRTAPLPFGSERKIEWNDAVEIVDRSFSKFSESMAGTARLFFENPWIDAAIREGKAAGAFSHPTSTEAHPCILLNYTGRPRDVMILAHELGHGVHQVLAADQGELLCNTPLTLAETASVFAEMLTFRSLLEDARDEQERLALLVGKIEDMINTVIRQIAFYEFESKLHGQRAKGELTTEEIGAIWMKVQEDSLGPHVRLMKGYESYWSYVPHFIHAPFYVYSYAFGNGLVLALYAEYESGRPGFEQDYIRLLKSGGSRGYKELLADFDLNPTEPVFWQKGLGFIEGLIDELEGLMKQRSGKSA